MHRARISIAYFAWWYLYKDFSPVFMQSISSLIFLMESSVKWHLAIIMMCILRSAFFRKLWLRSAKKKFSKAEWLFIALLTLSRRSSLSQIIPWKYFEDDEARKGCNNWEDDAFLQIMLSPYEGDTLSNPTSIDHCIQDRDCPTHPLHKISMLTTLYASTACY